jgi:hypothetical protein
MNIRKHATLFLAAAVSAIAILASAGTAPAYAAPNPGVSDVSASWYLNEWGGNTDAGGPVKIYQAGANNEFWGVESIDRCNSTPSGTVTHTCPFQLGSGLNDAYFGHSIVQFYYRSHSTTCVGTDTSSGLAINRSCNNVNNGTGGGTGTVFILNTFQNPFRYDAINLYWTGQFNNNVNFMCSNGASNGASISLSHSAGTCGGNFISPWTDWN